MNKRVTTLAEQAEQLSPEERIELIERLQVSLHRTDPEVEKAWAVESERRVDAYLRGATTAKDAREVLAKYRRS
jgi:putative addiction module component (TIGR02574 family)